VDLTVRVGLDVDEDVNLGVDVAVIVPVRLGIVTLLASNENSVNFNDHDVAAICQFVEIRRHRDS
jgi:hypothetical protein